jgi:hypothetical protein
MACDLRLTWVSPVHGETTNMCLTRVAPFPLLLKVIYECPPAATGKPRPGPSLGEYAR